MRRQVSVTRSITVFGSYLIASVTGTFCHYALMVALMHWSGLHAVYASTWGAALGALVIYALNYYLTFNSGKPHRVAFARFVVVTLLSVALNGVILQAMLTVLPLPTMVLQLFTTLLVFMLTYFLNRTWTF